MESHGNARGTRPGRSPQRARGSCELSLSRALLWAMFELGSVSQQHSKLC